MTGRRFMLKRKADTVTSYRINPNGPAKKIKSQLSAHQNTQPSHISTEEDDNGEHASFDPENTSFNDDPGLNDNGAGVRTFKDRKDKEAEQWALIRSSLLAVATEESGVHLESSCSVCLKSPTNIRCLSCGPSVYYCSSCVENSHELYNQTHVPEVYRNGLYLPYKWVTPRKISRVGHHCESKYLREVVCITVDGRQHNILFEFCNCESDVETLCRLNYWPATPKIPTLAFHFEFMNWMEALLLECQVAAKDFSAAVKYKTQFAMFSSCKPRSIYPVIINAFEEYRHFHNQLWRLSHVYNDLDDSICCPACSQEGSAELVSMDANFGLCRKKTSGTSERLPLSEQRFFEDQNQVDAFVQSYKSVSSKSSSNCSQFLAGNVIRSQSRYKALDETAVFGSCCRHGFPRRFLNLKHGERLSYAVWILRKLDESAKYSKRNLMILYDVACQLKLHLKNSEFKDLLSLPLGIPVFHAFGHRMECQVELSARRLRGYGLTDGEGMERLWSYLRRFSRMTKEMRPSHRQDILSDALQYYSNKVADGLSKSLPLRIHRAVARKNDALKILGSIMSDFHVSEQDIASWMLDEQQASPSCTSTGPIQWKEQYVVLLEKYYGIMEELNSIQHISDHLYALPPALRKLDAQLKSVERQQEVERRWERDDESYKRALSISHLAKAKHTYETLMRMVRERWFLLSVKARFAEGHVMASRISRRITAVHQKLKVVIEKYNSIRCQVLEESSMPGSLTWDIVTNIQSCLVTSTTEESIVPTNVKRTAVDQTHLIHRCDEEVELVKQEMLNTYTFLLKHHNLVVQKLEQRTDNTVFNVGVITLLKSKLLFLELQLVQCHSSFSQHIEMVSPPSVARTYVFDGSLELHLPPLEDISADSEATLDQSECPEDEEMEDEVDPQYKDGESSGMRLDVEKDLSDAEAEMDMNSPLFTEKDEAVLEETFWFRDESYRAERFWREEYLKGMLKIVFKLYWKTRVLFKVTSVTVVTLDVYKPFFYTRSLCHQE